MLPPPTISVFRLTICFTTLKTLPSSSALSSDCPHFTLSASFTLPITFLASFFDLSYFPFASLQGFLLLSTFPCFNFCISPNNLLFSFTTLSHSSFQHHVSLCLGGPLVMPHTSSAAFNMLPFIPAHIPSTPSPSFSPSSALILSLNPSRTASSFNFHVLHLPLCPPFFIPVFSLSTILQTISLCCGMQASPPITPTSLTTSLCPLYMFHNIFVM